MAHQSFQQAINKDNTPYSILINGESYFGFFADIRVDRRTLPENWYAYDIRDSENGLEVCELVNGYVFANHFGSFCTRHPLPLDLGDSLYYSVYDPDKGYEKDSFDYDYPDVDRHLNFENLYYAVSNKLRCANNYLCYKDFENLIYESISTGVPVSLAKINDAEILFSCDENKEYTLSFKQGSKITPIHFKDDKVFVKSSFCDKVSEIWQDILSKTDIPEWKIKYYNLNSHSHRDLFELKRDVEILLSNLDGFADNCDFRSKHTKEEGFLDMSSAYSSVSNKTKEFIEPLENIIKNFDAIIKNFDKKTSVNVQKAKKKNASNSR